MAVEANSNASANADMPIGWSDKYEDMGGSSAWDDTFGSGTVLAVELGLGKPKPLMARLNNYGGGQYIFEPEAKPGELFMWQPEVNEIDRITSPTTLTALKQLISTGKYSDLKTETVKPPTAEQQEAHMREHLAAL